MSVHCGHDENSDRPPEVERLHYDTVFNINVSKAEVMSHPGRTRVMRVKDGAYSLHQKSYNRSPSKGDGFISNRRTTRMIFNCPEMVRGNVSLFVVFRLISTPTQGDWGYIVGNDDGNWDKFIGYKSNSTDQLSYGGGWPPTEYNCTIPSGVDRTKKHLISCHWLLEGGHIRFNDIISTDSHFRANPKGLGQPYGSVFSNERFSLRSQAADNVSGELYGLRVVSGFLEGEDITKINKSMMMEYNIVV